MVASAVSANRRSGVSGPQGSAENEKVDPELYSKYSNEIMGDAGPGGLTPLSVQQQKIKDKIQKIQEMKRGQKNRLSLTGNFTAGSKTNSSHNMNNQSSQISQLSNNSKGSRGSRFGKEPNAARNAGSGARGGQGAAVMGTSGITGVSNNFNQDSNENDQSNNSKFLN